MKLEIQSNQGQFVHDNQNMAKENGFACVSRLWYDKTIPITEGIDKIIDESKNREDILAPAKHMRLGLNDDGKIVVEYIDGREFIPNDHGMMNLAKWCDVSLQFLKDMSSPKLKPNNEIKYRRDNTDNEVLLQVLKNGYRRIKPDNQFRFRTYSDGTLRAMLSKVYGIINNEWYLQTVANMFKEIGRDEPRLSHWRGNADTIFGNILIPDTCREEDDSDYGGMLSISNCEIGKRVLSQRPSVFRAICMNGCIWDQNQGVIYKKRHRGKINLGDIRERIVLNLQTQIPLMPAAITRFLQTKDFAIDKKYSMANVFAQVAVDNKLSAKQIGNVVTEYTYEQNDRNLFGIINSVTRAGQKEPPETWVQYDTVAGNMMNWNRNAWDKFLHRSEGLTKEQTAKIFAVV